MAIRTTDWSGVEDPGILAAVDSVDPGSVAADLQALGAIASDIGVAAQTFRHILHRVHGSLVGNAAARSHVRGMGTVSQMDASVDGVADIHSAMTRLQRVSEATREVIPQVPKEQRQSAMTAVYSGMLSTSADLVPAYASRQPEPLDTALAANGGGAVLTPSQPGAQYRSPGGNPAPASSTPATTTTPAGDAVVTEPTAQPTVPTGENGSRSQQPPASATATRGDELSQTTRGPQQPVAAPTPAATVPVGAMPPAVPGGRGAGLPSGAAPAPAMPGGSAGTPRVPGAPEIPLGAARPVAAVATPSGVTATSPTGAAAARPGTGSMFPPHAAGAKRGGSSHRVPHYLIAEQEEVGGGQTPVAPQVLGESGERNT